MNQFIADRRILATSCCILSAFVNSLKPVVAGKIPLVVYGATAPGLPGLPWVYSVTALPGPKDTETAATVAFGGVHAVSDLSFAIRRGAVAGLMGPNGAGKMSFGCKLTEGTPADCLAHPAVQEAYFGRY